MNVRVLQQFLHNLVLPLQASAASGHIIAGLERACQGLEPFGDKDVTTFAEFLSRAANYEREGKWPSENPPLAGHVVDEPSPHDYALRLRTFLEREQPQGTPIADSVRAELQRLEKLLKPAGIKAIAKDLQIEESFSTAKQGIEKIIFRLTGQNLSDKKSSPPRKKQGKLDAATIQQYAAELRNLTGSEGLEQRLRELVAELSGPNLKTLAEILGATKRGKKKNDWIPIFLAALRCTTPERAASAEVAIAETSSQDAKIARLMEIVTSLKSKADGPDAPYDEIDAELRSLEDQMDRDEAIAIAKGVGIARHLKSRNEAIEEIHHKVFEMKRARESIAY